MTTRSIATGGRSTVIRALPDLGRGGHDESPNGVAPPDDDDLPETTDDDDRPVDNPSG